MNYTATIRVDSDLMGLFDEDLSDRSEVRISYEEGQTVFEVRSKDSVALRAALNSITKLFTAYEAMDDGSGKGK